MSSWTMSSERETIESAQIIKRNGEHLLDSSTTFSICRRSRRENALSTPRLLAQPDCFRSRCIDEGRADAKGLPLTLEVRDDVPETITTDPIRLRQILVNLVGNAIKFTEVGGVRVVMRLASASENGGQVDF